MLLSKITGAIKSFNEDEDGLEAVQVVMIVAIAALVLIAVSSAGQEVVDWADEQIQKLISETDFE